MKYKPETNVNGFLQLLGGKGMEKVENGTGVEVMKGRTLLSILILCSSDF
jgi:hypothetical protein